MVTFSDTRKGTIVYNVSYAKRLTHVEKEDINIYSSLVYCKKGYHFKITATTKLRLVVVVKKHTKPELGDFYGGERLSKSATLLVVDFAKTRQSRMENRVISSGLEFVVEDGNSSSVGLFGTVYCNEETTTAYVGIMPTVYDPMLCKRCMETSNDPCGFCSGMNEREGNEVRMNVSLTIVRYVTDCMFWDPNNDNWKNDGCQVSLQCCTLNIRWCVVLLYAYVFVSSRLLILCMSVFLIIFIINFSTMIQELPV